MLRSAGPGPGLALFIVLRTLPHASADEPAFTHHPDITVSVFASEPLVVDPVALAFAANGDLFVVEMRDYLQQHIIPLRYLEGVLGGPASISPITASPPASSPSPKPRPARTIPSNPAIFPPPAAWPSSIRPFSRPRRAGAFSSPMSGETSSTAIASAKWAPSSVEPACPRKPPASSSPAARPISAR